MADRTIVTDLIGHDRMSRPFDTAGNSAIRNSKKLQTFGDKSIDVSGKVGGLSKTLIKGSAVIGSFAAASVGGVHATAALAGGILSLGGAAAALPAAAAGAGVALGVVKLAVMGLADAFEASADDPEAYAEALDKMAPAAAKATKQAVALKPALWGVQQSVQGGFFRAWQDDITPLAGKWLPMLRVQLAGIASEMGEGVDQLTNWAKGKGPLHQVDHFLGNIRTTTRALAPSLTNLTSGMLNFITAGSDGLPRMATAFTRLTDRFDNWTGELADSGELQEWVDGGIESFKQLMSVGSAAGRIIGGIFSASSGTGGGGLEVLAETLDKIADKVNEPAFQGGLEQVFRSFGKAADYVSDQLPLVGDALVALAPAFSDIVEGGGALFGGTLKAAAEAAIVLAPTINAITSALVPLAPILGPLLPYLFLASKAFTALKIARTAAEGTKLLGGSLKALNMVAKMTLFGRIATIVLLVGTALVTAYKNSETFRNVVNEAFAAVGTVVLTFVGTAIRAFATLVDVWLGAAGIIIGAAEKAFGWIPGLGDKLKTGKKAFDSFADGVQSSFDDAIEKTDEWKENLNRMPKVARLKGDITDLSKKIADGKAKLKTVPKEKRAALKADIAQWQRQLRRARDDMAKVRGKTVTLTVIRRDLATHQGRTADEYRAEGGPVTKGRSYIVGEKRPELFVPTENGVIIPRVSPSMHRAAEMGGSTVHITNHLTVVAPNGDARTLVKTLEDALDELTASGYRSPNLVLKSA